MIISQHYETLCMQELSHPKPLIQIDRDRQQHSHCRTMKQQLIRQIGGWIWPPPNHRQSESDSGGGILDVEATEGSAESLLSGVLSDGQRASGNNIPKGFLAVYVGPGRRRFVIPTSCLSSPDFKALMDRAAEEYGFEQEGALYLPCDEQDFENILFRCLTRSKKNDKKSKKKPIFFWVNALAPLCCVITASVLVWLTHAEKHPVQVTGKLKKGLNPVTVSGFKSSHLSTAIKSGIISGIIGLAEGVAVGRSFATIKNYHIDGNKEMIAFGSMNLIGSCVSCILSAGPFSRTAVNSNAGCKTVVSNIVMAIMMMLTLLFLIPLFQYTPLVVLSSIIIVAMIGIIDFPGAIHLWKIDKLDFVICMSAFLGYLIYSVELGLGIAIIISILRVILSVARPRTFALGNIPDSPIYRSVDQYPAATTIPGILVLQIDAPIYFANSNYLRERISRWIYEEEDRIQASGGTSLNYIILDLTPVGGIDTSGITMLKEVKKNIERKGLKLVLANPRSEVIKKLDNSKFIEQLGREWMYLTVGEAVTACKFLLHTDKQKLEEQGDKADENV